jgi:hypothetical protein
LDHLLDKRLTPSIAQLAPFMDAAAIELEILEGGLGSIVRSLDNRIVIAAPLRHLAPLLGRVDLVGQPQLGELDDPQAIGLHLNGGVPQPRVMQRGLRCGSRLQQFGACLGFGEVSLRAADQRRQLQIFVVLRVIVSHGCLGRLRIIAGCY